MLTALAVGAMAGAQIYQGMAAEAQGRSVRNIEEYNASVKEQEAAHIEQMTSIKQRQMAEEAERTKSTLEARLGFGGGVGKGPLELLARQTTESERGILTVGHQGQTEAQRARLQANLHRLYGKTALRQGKAARTAAFIGAGATVITPFAMKFNPKWWGGNTALTPENKATLLKF